MNDIVPSHACREQTPSGAYRAAIGWTTVGETCRYCGVLITEKYAFWPQASDSTAQAQADKGKLNHG